MNGMRSTKNDGGAAVKDNEMKRDYDGVETLMKLERSIYRTGRQRRTDMLNLSSDLYAPQLSMRNGTATMMEQIDQVVLGKSISKTPFSCYAPRLFVNVWKDLTPLKGDIRWLYPNYNIYRPFRKLRHK